MRFAIRIWRDITRDYEGNALSSVKRYIPLLAHSGLLAQRIIGYIGIISILVYLVGYGMHFLRKL